ncbi:MAG: glycoside hydrolase 43 family protein [Sphingobacteriaceae bacterium]|nr:glycoside hydrolase 43 family protein [Sphingobacteriaceae bacterium]
MFKSLVKTILFCLVFTQKVRAQKADVPKWGDWQTWGDQGNGTYRNPILPGDYSDIDCIRVGDDYYAVSSTFHYSPGFIILHSKDMVNWKILSHAVNDISAIASEMNWDKMDRYGRGIWAGAIRYHDNKFWIYFGDPDMGYFMTTAKKAEGPWEPLTNILPEKGWDDCCPFWDDDGQGYFIGTNFADGYKIHLWKMTPDGKKLIKESDKVIYSTKGSEANKLFKIKDTYYHFFSEVKSGARVVMMERSKNIWGPYEGPKQLSHAQKQFNEPNQGGIVQTKKGDWYFLTHHGSGGDWSGRIMSLIPVNWVDGWPILGEVGPDKIGTMPWTAKKPVMGKEIVTPQSSDEFDKPTLPQQWEWNYQPRNDKWSLTERKGWLRLHAFKPIIQNDLLKAGNTLTQRSMRTKSNEVIIKLDLKGMADGQKAGLTHFGRSYSAIGAICDGTTKKLEFNVKGTSTIGPVLTGNNLWLKSTWGLDGLSQYYYSTDGKKYISFGGPYQMAWGSYRGDRLGVYNYNNKAEAGYIDVDFFCYDYAGPKKKK